MHNPKWVFNLSLLLTFFALIRAEEITPCSETDRLSLLGFKARILKDTTDTVSSWTGRDCCGGGWEGIQCDSSTGRVTGLIVQSPSASDKGMYMKGTLSPTLGGLEFLEVMVLSGLKRIQGPIPESFSNLTRLTALVLEDNSIEGTILPSLGNLPLLKTLSLSGNKLEGQIPPSLGNFKNLVQLNLGRNQLTGPIPLSFKNFVNLQYLDLSFNSLSGLIPDFIGQFVNLTNLDLSNNMLSGQIPVSLSNLVNLNDLSLSNNQLEGSIPSQIGNLKTLSTLSLNSNNLSGQIPESISGLSNLWNLSLSRNSLSNPLPIAFSIGLPSLLSIDLSYNNFGLDTVPRWVTNRNFSTVNLAGCNLKGTLPIFIQPEILTAIDLSDNYFTSGLANLFSKATNLQQAKLSRNQLNGNLSTIFKSITSRFLEVVDLSNNQISGNMPEFSNLGRLKEMNISRNQIIGHIPNSISSMIDLERLDISRNQITGTIPQSVGQLVKLRWLDLSANGLSGRIPAELLGIENLGHANFRSNRLCGEIPQGRPLNVFKAVAYAHNLCLCGTPLPACKAKRKRAKRDRMGH